MQLSARKSEQRLLFEPTDENGRTIRHKKRTAVTFKGGLDRLAHRWFRLTPSYSPELVSSLLAEFGHSDTTVLDPFSGRGTTLIECQLQNVRAIGVEINPMLYFAARVSLIWRIPACDAKATSERVIALAKASREKLHNASATEIAERLQVHFPTIHNVFRWWREDVLCDLLALKASINLVCDAPDMRDLLLLALANILLEAANITLGRLQLHFIDRSHEEIDSFAMFARAVGCVCEDLEILNSQTVSNCAEIYLGDSLELNSILGNVKVGLVITSPPYPNRYSYVWNTRPHLYFLDLFKTPKDAGDLDCRTVGGTWGTATSRHLKTEYTYSHVAVERTVAPIVNAIREKDFLMSNYVAMYFDDLYKHIAQLERHLEKGAVCAYVVGNSRIKKIVVETDLLLSVLFQDLGFRTIRLEQIRKRNSGKELHETIVITEKC